MTGFLIAARLYSVDTRSISISQCVTSCRLRVSQDSVFTKLICREYHQTKLFTRHNLAETSVRSPTQDRQSRAQHSTAVMPSILRLHVRVIEASPRLWWIRQTHTAPPHSASSPAQHLISSLTPYRTQLLP